MGTLERKRALVTGGSRGIGRAIAVALAREGADVAFTYSGSPEAARETRARAEAAGGRADAYGCDVTEEGRILELFEALDERWGGLDILVNNAGVILEKPLLETSAAEFDRLMAVNLRGSFLTGREALRRMSGQAAGGRVINVSSDLGFLGREQFSVYCASKGAINALTRSWAREFAPAILVNAIAPGPIDTDMLDIENMSPEWRCKEEDIPLRRIGTPDEVAGLAVFLAGPAATFITGQIIGANGGSVMP